MKDPFGKEINVGDIILYTWYSHLGPTFTIAKVIEISSEVDRIETRSILKAKIIKTSGNLEIGHIFSSYNSNVLLLKSIKGAV